MAQLAAEPSPGQEQDVGGPESAFSASAPGASVGAEAGDAACGEDAPHAATKIAVDAIAAQYPTTVLWLRLNMAAFYPGEAEFVESHVGFACVRGLRGRPEMAEARSEPDAPAYIFVKVK